jgi:hypothetical protein
LYKRTANQPELFHGKDRESIPFFLSRGWQMIGKLHMTKIVGRLKSVYHEYAMYGHICPLKPSRNPIRVRKTNNERCDKTTAL